MLSDLQQEFSRAMLAGEIPAIAFAPGAVPVAAALKVHRGTVLGALADALRLTYPTVEKLVGTEFFDMAASAYAQSHPPTSARLSQYGDAFPAFLQGFAPAAPLVYLGDVARLDLALDRTMQSPASTRRFMLEDTVALDLPASLTVLRLKYPADQIRDAVAAGTDVALHGIDLTQTPQAFVLWRRDTKAALRDISLAAAAFLETLLSSADTQTALDAAMAIEPDNALAAIQSDVFAASYCKVTQL